MLCQICHINEASIHIQKVVGKTKTTLHLCPECAQYSGVNDQADGNLKLAAMAYKITAQKLGLEAPATDQPDAEAHSQTCPECGLDSDQFATNGRVGCPTCYETFDDLIAPLLARIQRGTKHLGRTPKNTPAPQSPPAAPWRNLADQLKRLEDELVRAIHNEQYEDAASLRDQIKHLNETCIDARH